MMIRQPISKPATVIAGIVSVALLLVLYTWMAHRQKGINPDDRSIPVWKQLGEGVKTIIKPHPRSQEIWLVEDAKATGTRLFLGLGVGLVIAIVIGLLGCLSICEAFFTPPLSMAAKIPPTAIMAVFFAFLPLLNQIVSTTEEYNLYIAIIAFGLIPMLAQTIYLAIRDVPDELIYKGYTLGASHLEVSLHIVFRIILPKVIDAIRLQIGPAMVYLIAAEMLCADRGFGFRIRLQSRLVHMDIVYPYLASLAIFGFAMDYTLKRLQRWLCPWYSTKGI